MPLRRILTHVFCWALFIIYEVSIARYMGDHSTLLAFACFYVLDIGLFYFNAHVVLNNFASKKSISKYLFLVIAIMGELIVYAYLSVVLNNALKEKNGVNLFFFMKSKVAASAIWRGIYFIGLSVAYWSVLRFINAIKNTTAAKISELNAQNRSQKLEKDVLILRNAYLQARINPHFLFNTLNFLYNQAEEKNPGIGANIVLLSEIMQYSLSTEAEDGKVPLYKEIQHIKRYIRLNLSRFDQKLFLGEKIDEIPNKEARIPPLILLTFVENLFKHGDMTDKAAPGMIIASYRDNCLDFLTRNKKRKEKKDNREHVGIQNALTRLNNFYPEESFTYSINEEFEIYTFILKLSL
jgi:sensor histidine kinase YesM